MVTDPETGETGSIPAAGPPPRAVRNHLLALLAAVTLLAYTADQVTKWLAVDRLDSGEVVPVIEGWLSLRLLYNSGAAFSMGEGATWVFTAVAVVVTGVILRVASTMGSRRWAATLGFLLAGALGNLTDRLVREPGFARGHVVDFIDYNGFFVGNVADIWIVGAAVMIGLLGLTGVGPDGTRQRDEAGGQRG